MKVLHLIKTGDGAAWAVDMVEVLLRHGVDVHVVLPTLSGRMGPRWLSTGAVLHEANIDIDLRHPWLLPSKTAIARDLVTNIAPDLIHSHFVGTTYMMRLAIRGITSIPLLFQVPGPLHLEHVVTRNLDLRSAGSTDMWIASSKAIHDLFRNNNVPAERLFLSYYGNKQNKLEVVSNRSGRLRESLGIPEGAFVAGNINYIYPPKRYLGQRIGLKGHEILIDAFGEIAHADSSFHGVLIGSQFSGGTGYEDRLRALAEKVGSGSIHMPGFLTGRDVSSTWPDFDCAVHVPTSENCGGVVEPLMAGVPAIAARVGGLPEVVIDELTGLLVPPCDSSAVVEAVKRIREDSGWAADMAERGRQLVRTMFDVERTAGEIFDIYNYVLGGSSHAPAVFDSRDFTLNNS